MTIRQKAGSLPLATRYQFLLSFILPEDRVSRLRMPVVFAALNSEPPEGGLRDESKRRVETGGRIASPFLDLVEIAAKLDRLDEVRIRIEGASSESSAEQIARLAALTIVAVVKNEAAVATQHLAKVYEIVSAKRELREESEGPLLLAIQAGAKHPETRAAASDLAYDLHQTHLDLVAPSDWKSYHRHVAAMTQQMADARNEVAGDETEEIANLKPGPADQFGQWQSGSLFTAESRGTGCPPNVWIRDATGLHKTFGHSIDLLYFQSPLHGDFNVECDASVFSWRSIHPTYGGHWAGVESSRTRRRIGTLAELDSKLLPLASQLTKFRHEIHYRISVRGRQMEVYGNGRLLHSLMLPRDHDPWLALRRSAKNSASIWNIRVTGAPRIPSEIRISETPYLTGWIPYFGGSTGDANSQGTHWRQAGSAGGEGIISGQFESQLPSGALAERLLYYHRPMLEDGTIEYEFFYRAGKSVTHPAIDRAVFMLTSEGVAFHSVTDGMFDRSDRSPDNLSIESQNGRGPAALPLKENQWNAVRLNLTGDTVNLFLNGQHVYERQLENTNQRNFGLFHYADRSHAAVRNVVWKGDWPNELPSVYDQELAGDDTEEIDRTANQLPTTFRHSFDSELFPFERFTVSAGEMSDTRPGANGLYVQRHGSQRYQRTVLAAQLAIGGDFDISASFDSLVTKPSDGGHSSLSVSVLLADEAATQTNYRRRHNAYAGREHQHLAYADVSSTPKSGLRRTNIGYKPADSSSGTLRVARRGNRLYTLFAEGDSTSFRITGESEFPTDDSLLGGILLSALTFEDSFVSFRWKEMTVRAERITGPAVDAAVPVAVLADLDRKREQLPAAGDFDFGKQAPSDEEFYQWGNIPAWDDKGGGQLIIHAGRPAWAASGLTPRKAIDGDFDITTEFDLKKIVDPAAGDRSTVYLKTSFGATGETHASLMFDINTQDDRQVFARLGTRRQNDGYDYRIVGALAAAEISVLRVARYGKTMYFLARRDMKSPQHLIGTAQVSDEPVYGRAANFIVHSGGEGRETHVVLKSLKIRATRFTSTNDPIRLGADPSRMPPPQSRSFFDSVIDFFK
jgi:hypothetical protein